MQSVVSHYLNRALNYRAIICTHEALGVVDVVVVVNETRRQWLRLSLDQIILGGAQHDDHQQP